MRPRTAAAIVSAGLLILLILGLLLRPPAGRRPAGSGTPASDPPAAASPGSPAATPETVPVEASVTAEPAPPAAPLQSIAGRAFLHDRSRPLCFATLKLAESGGAGESEWTVIKTDDAGRFSTTLSHGGAISVTFRHRSYEPLTLDLKPPQPPELNVELV